MAKKPNELKISWPRMSQKLYSRVCLSLKSVLDIIDKGEAIPGGL